MPQRDCRSSDESTGPPSPPEASSVLEGEPETVSLIVPPQSASHTSAETFLRSPKPVIVRNEKHQVGVNPSAPPAIRRSAAELFADFRLDPVAPGPVEPFDSELDLSQRDAIARALSTPDLCLIQGQPGTGKSRVIVEIVRQAVRRREKVLLLAPGPAAVDQVLKALAHDEAACPVRCLGPDEVPGTLPLSLRRLTVQEWDRTVRDRRLARLARDEETAAGFCAALQACAGIWDRLAEIASRLKLLEEQLERLTARRTSLDERASPGTFLPTSTDPLDLSAAARERDSTITRLEEQSTVIREELDKIRAEAEAVSSDQLQLNPLIEARDQGRFWTPAWWRSLARTGLRERSKSVHLRLIELHEARERLETEYSVLAREREAIEEYYDAERNRLVREEQDRRRSELDREEAKAETERGLVLEAWKTALGQLPEVIRRPSRTSATEVAAARDEWSHRLEEAEAKWDAVRRDSGAVIGTSESTNGQLFQRAKVVGALFSSLASEPIFRTCTESSFDLLIVEEAEKVTESEFLKAARFALRWVLVGEPGPEMDPPRSLRPTGLRAGMFQRLWRQLHPDPCFLPYSWSHEEGRLRCRFRPVPPGHEQWLEREPVTDRPEIELRILTPPRSVPELTEIVFPVDMTIEEAKGYVISEVDQCTICSPRPHFRWSESGNRSTLHLSESPVEDGITIELSPGLWEVCSSQHWEQRNANLLKTHSLVFDHDRGWTPTRAEQWVHQQLGLLDRGRTSFLSVPHRMKGPLAGFLSDLLFSGGYSKGGRRDSEPEASPSVEFIAVPSLESKPVAVRRSGGDSRRRGGGTTTVSPRLRLRKGGAGLEVQLSDHRRLDPLPSELRAFLPASGLVNYPEAQAVVRHLEHLNGDEAFRSHAGRWQERHGDSAVFVTAMSPAQAQLIDFLLQRSPTLASSTVTVECGPVSVFQQREAFAVLVSLTRSHQHRSVSYGEGPHALVQAFTRATDLLLLFGDPGTLARRGQWDGPLDHLGSDAAARERHLVTHLWTYLQGRGALAEAFHIRQGASV